MSCSSAQAATFPDKPSSQDYFVDQAGLIADADKKSINALANALLTEEAIPLFIVTIASLSAQQATGLGVERYSQELFDHWGIGTQERNYGILLLISAGDRKARIELGKGFDNKYDKQTDDIMQSLIVPAFRKGNFSTGIVDGARGLDAMARGLQLPKAALPAWFFPTLIVEGIFLAALIFSLFKNGKSGWAWGLIALIGGSYLFRIKGSGSSGGFDGGSSGGGGSTGSW